ncbi:MAG: HupE/UreJ family protein [Gammaproteobacteria bacterium]|nr:HupE/UreJ family protein [Gammaproteobacteria bacterium]
MALRRSRLAALTIVPLLVGLPALAFAHTEEGIVGGFISGFLHPIYGPDHVVAMVAVGMWGAFLRNPAIWLLPVVFPLVMAFGGALGVIGIPLPLVEIGIASSAIVLGLMVLLAVRPPLWIAAVLVGAFGIFHGHAHGTELPDASNPLSYAIGFVLATGLMHVAGIAFGMLADLPRGRIAVRTAGGLISASGIYFLLGAI